MSAGLIERSRIDKLVRSYKGSASGKGTKPPPQQPQQQQQPAKVENNVVRAPVASPPEVEVDVEEDAAEDETDEAKVPVDAEERKRREMAARTMELQRAALERERVAREDREAAAAAEAAAREQAEQAEQVEEAAAEEDVESVEEEEPPMTRSEAEFEAMAALEAAAQAAADLPVSYTHLTLPTKRIV